MQSYPDGCSPPTRNVTGLHVQSLRILPATTHTRGSDQQEPTISVLFSKVKCPEQTLYTTGVGPELYL